MRTVVTQMVISMGLFALLLVTAPVQAQIYRPTKFQQDLRRAQTHLAAMQRLLNRVAAHGSSSKARQHTTRPSQHSANTNRHKDGHNKKH
ncbi:hypothetical protein CWRG_01638 [Chthonomonas calidirosea]|uniref:hypothetical protein n=1 Tax=Chthonomonas calidirosea TaxID=454171 RepID=UPI0006DD4229|nr:hypothetical protein [Chthonomonas calidirosea]CEK16869.1 hypothetical protein CWRG_01638 [Chthonomonas calidirosea]